MQLPLSSPLVTRLEVLEECASTNTLMVAAAGDDWPSFSAIVTDNQTSGRGRLGRSWSAPAGKSLAVSVLLRPGLDAPALGWLPLVQGVAMARAVRAVTGIAGVGDARGVGLKWPNDVLVGGLKVSGLLAELVPGAAGSPPSVVLGAGVNLMLDKAELPTETSSSLTLLGASSVGLLDRTLAAYLGELRSLTDAFIDARGDAEASGIAAAVRAECVTLGRSVRIQLPDGSSLVALAESIDAAGQLVVRRHQDGRTQAVAAGDITHLRYE